jgi:hypothetical protein
MASHTGVKDEGRGGVVDSGHASKMRTGTVGATTRGSVSRLSYSADRLLSARKISAAAAGVDPAFVLTGGVPSGILTPTVAEAATLSRACWCSARCDLSASAWNTGVSWAMPLPART